MSYQYFEVDEFLAILLIKLQKHLLTVFFFKFGWQRIEKRKKNQSLKNLDLYTILKSLLGDFPWE